MQNVITIGLDNVSNESELLSVIGSQLCLGGPEGNHKVHAVVGGWGLNWNALTDSLTCLDSGGIWGTSPTLQFPLFLRFSGAAQLAQSCPAALEELGTILLDVQTSYARVGIGFDFEINE